MNFFNYFETCSRAEREAMASELIQMYNSAVDTENETFLALTSCPDCESSQKPALRAKYFAASDKLGMIQGVFTVLGIEFEPGGKISVN